MSGDLHPSDRRWRLWGITAVLLAIVTGGLLGFVVIPIVQGNAGGIPPYLAICRAFGVAPGTPGQPLPRSEVKPQPASRVVWTPRTLTALHRADREAGAKLAQAQGCVGCHAPNGANPAPTIPRLTGQSEAAIFKELHDFRSGARENEIMSGMAKPLTDIQILDLAAYYSRLVRGDLDEQNPPFVGPDIDVLVAEGDSRRALPPCLACHGTRAGGPIETPTLTGQYPDYVAAQLKAFAAGERHNDIYARMRSIAAKLTPGEIERLSLYYTAPPR